MAMEYGEYFQEVEDIQESREPDELVDEEIFVTSSNGKDHQWHLIKKNASKNKVFCF